MHYFGDCFAYTYKCVVFMLTKSEMFRNALKKNQELAQEFALNNNAEEFQRMDLEIAKVNKLVKQLRSSVRRERLKNHGEVFLINKS